ncbi:hypothetical protein MLD38_028285 [Melastoma candidum]|uniref:Uncharacterized protein n=1 Tax=Melastoma candidum TaxID=119954 RepID=A0ACB9N0E4_9MYRT|nr:hypothetical protein MLD38_028285 [Melastoma candidum]
MDRDDSLNMRNWGYYEPTPAFRCHMGLQLMSSLPERSFLDSRTASVMAAASGNGSGGGVPFHQRDVGSSHSLYSTDYARDPWLNQRDKFLNVLSGSSYSMLPETSVAQHHMQLDQLQPDLVKNESKVKVEEAVGEVDGSGPCPTKKRQGSKGPKSPKPKKPKRGSHPQRSETNPSAPRVRSIMKCTELVINGITMDISSIPIPVCSCTGATQQCYRWGSGGWQSACCTTNESKYPLPMSQKRRRARIAGRKMSIGAFKKVLEKLAAEGYNFANPIDLKSHWAKHGTNKFVTIR